MMQTVPKNPKGRKSKEPLRLPIASTFVNGMSRYFAGTMFGMKGHEMGFAW